ncbi:hypothetical protein JCM10914A_48570 [Paenibacillus sp. JCM 10914]|uniref:DUF4395 domain-containing protein n=1 Tax=Paenibacillus sp. JCM 10914 TaxID=1236974 RepID=UPI0003CC67C2|nr:DUF4395 domain-containing protein [Paenibacillus sp. JCM 10914]GAE06459.1 hypothetical protein JCM10914_2621 [Paenibacillus sp. JCM 10914]
MKEIPLPLIKANQIGIVLFVLLSFIFQQPLFIYLLFLIQFIPLLVGTKANVFVLLAKPLIGKARLAKSDGQAAELARFNQSIAVILLGISSIAYLLGWHVWAYAASAMVAAAAIAAVLGYCVGCTIYYQYKRWKLLRERSSQ